LETITDSVVAMDVSAVEFYPGQIPMLPYCFIFCCRTLFVMGFVGMAAGFSNERSMNGGVWVGVGIVVLFVGPVLWSGIAACTNRRKSASLFSRGSDGARKP
jgi:hypothetical protein